MELTNLEEVEEFLEDHPEIEESLELFGISHKLYLEYLLAQRQPIFYTSDSTDDTSAGSLIGQANDL